MNKNITAVIMYLSFGIAPYSANGYEVVNNYSGTTLPKISNNEN